jgi:hypothetical protein
MAQVIFTSKTAPTGRALQALLTRKGVGNIRINWTGSQIRDANLNAHARTDKLRQFQILRESGVLVPDFAPASRTFPGLPPKPGWMARSSNHRKGRDFDATIRKRVDFWVEPLLLTEEKRLHVFKRPKGAFVTIRTATKVPVEGTETHPWVRSHDNGWRFSYGGGSTERERTAAKEAVAALSLDFGAVDLGTFCGQPLVLEVNTCPGLDVGNTLGRYVDEIAKHA